MRIHNSFIKAYGLYIHLNGVQYGITYLKIVEFSKTEIEYTLGKDE